MGVTFKPKAIPRAEEFPQAKDVTLEAPNTHAGKVPAAIVERKNTKAEVTKAIEKSIERGDIVPREKGTPTDTTDPELLKSFTYMLGIGADRNAICDTLSISRDTYTRLKRRYLEGVVDSLSEVGVMGMVALSFDGLEMAKRRTLQLIATMENKASDRQDLLNAIRTLKDIESDKISLLVKTGAIKVKKKTEISVHMEQLTPSSQPLLSGEKAQGTMVRLAAKLLEASEADEDGEDDQARTAD